MSVMTTKPVVKCSRCGKQMVVSHLETHIPDPDGILMTKVMKMIAKNALCDPCIRSREYYIREGRYQDWRFGR